MGLAPTIRLGAYEIVALIGSGGMGEVYQARDTRLDRIVALKVITSAGAVDPELRTRFEREARAISSLNHPHICVLHDIGRERPLLAPRDGTIASEPSSGDVPVDFLVMEYLEGETLAARLARAAGRSTASPTPPMTVNEAVAVAIQIASALDGAHRAGVVHRDLKPGNIMLTKGEGVGAAAGTRASSGPVKHVKLMDFGLARLTGADTEKGLGHGMVSLAELSLPTMSSPLTKKGTILGTLQYMSPEQLKGEDVDARTDIFAFGVVLYEMLSGRRPFEGKSQASVIGAILEHDPTPVPSLQPQTPPLLAELVARCLAKDPDERWQSARDLMRQLAWIATRNEAAASTAAPSQAQPALSTRLLRTSAALLAGAVIAGGAVAWILWSTPPPPPVVARFTFDLPEGQQFTRAGHRVVALSPDGTRLVYVANSQLYLRNMHELTATPISGTEGADLAGPVFSPDGQWVAFWSDGALRRVPVTGGSPMRLATAETPLGASWEDGRILLGQLTPPGIVEIPENGGEAKYLVRLDEKAGQSALSPQLVAGGQSVLFTLRTGEAGWDADSIVVHDLTTGARQVLLKGGTDARVLPTGHLVFTSATTMFAVPFDETRLMVTGGPVPVQQGIGRAGGTRGASQVAWSATGTFAFVHGGLASFVAALVWVDRQGEEEHTMLPPRNYGVRSSEMRLSPDGSRVVVTIYSDDVLNLGLGSASEVWRGDLTLGTMTRLSYTGQATSPVWSPNGQRACYDSAGEVFCQAADGSSAAEASFKVEGLVNARPFSPDGAHMLLDTQGAKTGSDIAIATLGPTVETRPLLNRTYSESAPAISPDGRWLAYQSDESGRAEVYVRPFPAVDERLWPISTGGGSEPRWARDGSELFFTVRSDWTAPGVVMSVAVKPGPTFTAGPPTAVWKIPAYASQAYDVAPDGRFLFHFQQSGSEDAPRPEIIVVQNWFEELKARVPTGAAK